MSVVSASVITSSRCRRWTNLVHEWVRRLPSPNIGLIPDASIKRIARQAFTFVCVVGSLRLPSTTIRYDM